MRGHRPRFRLSRAMLAVMAVAVLLAAMRALVRSYPHVRRCWSLAAAEERLSRSYRRAASRYRACVQAVPCSAAEYCDNACLDHVNAPGAGRPVASDRERASVAAEHRRAAEDHERAAELHAARARLYRRAAFRPSEPLPTWTAAEEDAADAFDRHRCDTF